jgi:hypothetical protein
MISFVTKSRYSRLLSASKSSSSRPAKCSTSSSRSRCCMAGRDESTQRHHESCVCVVSWPARINVVNLRNRISWAPVRDERQAALTGQEALHQRGARNP